VNKSDQKRRILNMKNIDKKWKKIKRISEQTESAGFFEKNCKSTNSCYFFTLKRPA